MLIANTSLRINESACREFSKLPKKKRSHTTAQITGSFCSVMFHSLSSTKWEGLTQKNSFLSQHFLAHFCTDTSKISIGSRKKKKVASDQISLKTTQKEVVIQQESELGKSQFTVSLFEKQKIAERLLCVFACSFYQIHV